MHWESRTNHYFLYCNVHCIVMAWKGVSSICDACLYLFGAKPLSLSVQQYTQLCFCIIYVLQVRL